MLTAIAFISITCIAYIFSLTKGPFWCLLAYANIYFNAPDPYYNWWAIYLPFSRWSLLTSAILVVSLILHRDKLSRHKFRGVTTAFIFCSLTLLISYTVAVFPEDAQNHAYKLFTFMITIYCIVRGVKTLKQYKIFLMTIIIMAGQLSLNAHLYGKRIHGRLENIGPTDATGSNEFALLLAAIIPLAIPFIKNGTKIERWSCIACMPLLLNAFILCNSRGAVVAVLLAGLVSLTLSSDMKIKKNMVVLLLLGVPMFVYLTDDQFVQRLSSLLMTSEAMENEAQINQLSSGRTEIWGYGVNMVQDYPLGAGPNAFKHLARFYMPDEVLTYGLDLPYGVRSAHNSYLGVLVDQGYLGLLIWLTMCIQIVWSLFKSFNKLKRSNLDNVFLKYNLFALNIGFFSTLFGGLFNSRVYYEFFWWQIAIITIASSFTNEAIKKNSMTYQLKSPV